MNNALYSQIKSALVKEPKILAAYVIGSAASEKLSPRSDFDLAVMVSNRKTLDEIHVYKLIRHLRFPKDLDLSVVDHTSSPIFLYQIISNGKRIYEKNLKTIEVLEASVLHNYYDTAHMRHTYEQSLKGKFSYAD